MSTPGTTACRRCAAPVVDGASACPHCGLPDPTAPPRDRRRLAVVVLALTALLAVVLVGVQLARSESPSDRVQCEGDAEVAGVPADQVCD